MGLYYYVICYTTCSINPPLKAVTISAVLYSLYVECTVVIIVHHAKQSLIKDLGAAKTVQYTCSNRWVYATYTLLPKHEIGQNQHENTVTIPHCLTSLLCKCNNNLPATRAATRQQRRLGEPLAAARLRSNSRQTLYTCIYFR